VNNLPTILEEALRLDAVGREAYLERVCGGNNALRDQIAGMIAAAASANAFFSEPAAPRPDQMETVAAPMLEGSGMVIGRYKLLQQIGEGGMGVVYMAEQTEPVIRRVALKIIKLGMDTRQVVARFEAERQALALMDHPNIARVLDGGATESGRPYFVMELVNGVPVTEFCDRNKLSASERLKLFIPVCHAIQSAHQKGIIHRDIKPSNVLVTLHHGEPMPKVIDFGIAKATNQKLTEKTLFTNFAMMIGTPAYMSPEQAEMSSIDVDTRTDVYSLGVLLYELLTGTTPFPEKRLRSAGYGEIQRIIAEEDPEKPSTRLSTLRDDEKTLVAGKRSANAAELSRSVQGDLDSIVMKCLEKDRRRRYETVNALAADTQRFLNNEPVTARPQTALNRLEKAVYRNKLAFASASAVFVALAIGVTVSLWQADRATRQRLAAEKERYIAKITLAQSAWERNNVDQLREILADTESDPNRGFEWFYWVPQTQLAGSTWRADTVGVWPMALSPDGQRMLTGGESGTVKLWDLAQGRLLYELKFPGSVRKLDFSPDGSRFLVGGDDSQGTIFETQAGQKTNVKVQHEAPVNAVAFSPDGKHVITGGMDSKAVLSDAFTGNKLLEFRHSNWIWAVAYAPNGKVLATGGADRAACIWNADSGRKEVQFDNPDVVYCLSFSPDGTQLLAGNESGTAILWDLETKRERHVFRGHSGAVKSARFSPDAQRVITGSEDNTCKVWDVGTGRELFTLKGHGSGVLSAWFSPDGQTIWTASNDGTVKRWRPDSGVSAAESGHNRVVLHGHPDEVGGLEWSPDGRRLITGSRDKTARVWDVESGRQIMILTNHTGPVWDVAFSPDGSALVTGSADWTVRVWDAVTSRELLVFTNHTGDIMSARFSPDSKKVVSSAWDGTVRFWDARNGRELLKIQKASGFSARVSPDGKWIAAPMADATVEIFDSSTGREAQRLVGHRGQVYGLDYSSDGRRIISAGTDRTARVWDAQTGKELFVLRHTDWVWNGKFSPDGRRILTTSEDTTAKLWDAETHREVLTLRGHTAPVGRGAFSPDGTKIATGSKDHSVRIWEMAQSDEMARWRKEREEATEAR
jgi:WD40 repeat protein